MDWHQRTLGKASFHHDAKAPHFCHEPRSCETNTLKATFRNQQTLAAPAVVEGFGYWSGKDVRVTFQPAPEDSGITFVRTDLQPAVRIQAHAGARIEAPRRTNLSTDGTTVEMIEHIMAALAALQIDNCDVLVDAAEMPGMDGSSLAFIDALTQAGIVQQSALRARLVVSETTRVGDKDSWIEARPPVADGMTVKYRLDYGEQHAIGRQTFALDITPESFITELAAARTFVLKAEADWLRDQGLGTRVGYSDLLVLGEDGPIENHWRFEDECARHKTLDVVGDLALAGCDLAGHFVAYRCGHRQNAELVKALLSENQLQEPLRKTA